MDVFDSCQKLQKNNRKSSNSEQNAQNTILRPHLQSFRKNALILSHPLADLLTDNLPAIRDASDVLAALVACAAEAGATIVRVEVDWLAGQLRVYDNGLPISRTQVRKLYTNGLRLNRLGTSHGRTHPGPNKGCHVCTRETVRVDNRTHILRKISFLVKLSVISAQTNNNAVSDENGMFNGKRTAVFRSRLLSSTDEKIALAMFTCIAVDSLKDLALWAGISSHALLLTRCIEVLRYFRSYCPTVEMCLYTTELGKDNASERPSNVPKRTRKTWMDSVVLTLLPNISMS